MLSAPRRQLIAISRECEAGPRSLATRKVFGCGSSESEGDGLSVSGPPRILGGPALKQTFYSAPCGPVRVRPA